jgi:hypothetical protein
VSRKLNKINLEEGAACMHCDHMFEYPYDRQPEMENAGENIVLKCPHCNLFTVFVESESKSPR